MAIHQWHKGISVTIVSGGKLLDEIPNPDEKIVQHENLDIREWLQLRTVSNYVEVPENKGEAFSRISILFLIKININPPYQIPCAKLGFVFFVDGKEVKTFHFKRPELTKAGGVGKVEIDGLAEHVPGSTRKFTKKDFRFAKVIVDTAFTDPAKVKEMREKMSSVGVIKVKLYETKCGSQGGKKTNASAEEFLGRSTKVPESSLKGEAKSHTTSLGPAKKSRGGQTWQAETLYGLDKPSAVYEFFYRSKEALQQLHIIERTPSPTPRPRSSSSVSRLPLTIPYLVPPALGNAGKSEMQHRLVAERIIDKETARLESQIAALKKKRQDLRPMSNTGGVDQVRVNVNIKREHDQHRNQRQARKRRAGERVEVDLTGDDDNYEMSC